MKRYFVLIAVLLSIGFRGTAQAVNNDAPAQRLAMRMRDSLSLSAGQYDSIYAINQRINQLNTAARLQYAQQIDSLQASLQRIEYGRDALYRPVLGVDKYLLYKRKKIKLLTAE